MLKIWVFAAAALLVAGCGPHEQHGGDAGPYTPDLSATDDSGIPPLDTDMAGTLAISPLDPVVTYNVGAAVPTVQFSATVNGMSVAPQWTIDRGEIGTIGVGDGRFTAGGTIAGTAHVTATFAGQTVMTSVTVKFMQSQNGDPAYPTPSTLTGGGYGGVGGDGPGGSVTSGQQGTLSGTPTADAAVQILYPYNDTVWPRGLLAPLLQWDPTANHTFDAVMIKLHEKSFDYTGYFGKPQSATTFQNLPIPEDVWHTLTYSNGGAGDDITVTLVFEDVKSGTPTAIGPYTLTWHVAPATLRGTVYYNSYGTGLLKNSGEPSCGTTDTNCGTKSNRHGPEFGAATLAIKPGATAPVVAAGSDSPGTNTGCRVCHSVSANGQKLITQHGDNYAVSGMYDLQNPGPEIPVSGTAHSWPALAPDGSWFMSHSGVGIATAADTTTQAYNQSGALLPVQPTTLSGLKAAVPAFSPDGKHMSFSFWGGPGADQKSLAALDYDPASQVFANARTLFTPTTGKASWSSFVPTNDAVVFEDELVSGNAQFGFTWINGQGQLWWVDLATQTAHTLDKANGAGYLPTFGAHTGAADATMNYEPTVNPVASGGYAWVVFTSRRLYGNVATISGYTSDPRLYNWQQQVTPKKLWVAAIDLNATPGTDPSHPAFYLPGQELLAGNSRGFWTVDPCHPDGTGCETGDECCGGYCRPGGDGGALICTKDQPSCAQVYEKCMQTSDCCGAASGVMCINGICSQTTPIP